MSFIVDVRDALASDDSLSALRLFSDPSNLNSLKDESMEIISELFRTLLTQYSSISNKTSDSKIVTCIESLQITIDAAKPREAFLALLAEADRFLPSNALRVLLNLFSRCLTRLETTPRISMSPLEAAASNQFSNLQKTLPYIEQLCQSLSAHIHSLSLPSPSLPESAREAPLGTLSLPSTLSGSDPVLASSLATLGAVLDFVRDSLLPLYSRQARAFADELTYVERFRFELARLLLSALDRPLKFLHLLPLRVPLDVARPPTAHSHSKLSPNRAASSQSSTFKCDCCAKSGSPSPGANHQHCVHGDSPNLCSNAVHDSSSDSGSADKAAVEKQAGLAKQTADRARDLLRQLYPNAQSLLELSLEHNERERIRRTRAVERRRSARENLPTLRPGAAAPVKSSEGAQSQGTEAAAQSSSSSQEKEKAADEVDEYEDRSVSVGGVACLSYLLHGEAALQQASSSTSTPTSTGSSIGLASPALPSVLHPRYLLEFNMALAIALLEAGPAPSTAASSADETSAAKSSGAKAGSKGEGKHKHKHKAHKTGEGAGEGDGGSAAAAETSESGDSPTKKAEPQVGVALQHCAALKGLLLLASRLPGVPDECLEAGALETGDYKALIALLFRTMVFNELKSSRTLALQVFTALYAKFGSEGRYRLILHVFETFEQVSVKAHAISLLKDEIAANWRRPTPLPLFLADGLERMYEHIFRLPHGASTDVMSVKEAALAGVNLLRYLVLLDSPAADCTGIWRALERRVERECVGPLREAIALQRHQYELALDRVAEQARERQRREREQGAGGSPSTSTSSTAAKGKGNAAAADVDLVETGLDIRVGNMMLPPMPARQTADMMHGALAALDLVHSVLARTTDLIAQRRAEAKSTSPSHGPS